MKSFTQLSLAASLFTTAFAQQQYTINPNSVSNATREGWCTQQLSQCPLICLQTAANSAETLSNDCDATSLTFACVCSNGISPNVSEYSQTLPYYICQEWGNQCVSNCGNGNNVCANNCRAQHPCGAQNPTLQNTSTLTSTMMSTTSSANGAARTTDNDGETIYSGFGGAVATGSNAVNSNNNGGSSGSSGDHTGAAASLLRFSAAQTFGTLALVGGFVGGFAILL